MSIQGISDVDHKLALLGATDASAALLRQRRVAQIGEARRAGATWDEVADVLHVSRQAAAQKYGRGAKRSRPSA